MMRASAFSARMILRAASTRAGPASLHLFSNDHVGEFHLVGQQIDQRARIGVAHHLSAVGQEIVAGEVGRQVHRIDHRHHRVQPRHVGQAGAAVIRELEVVATGSGSLIRSDSISR